MSEMRDILLEQVERLLAEHSTPDLLRRAEAGEWPAALWEACEEMGLTMALCDHIGWDDAVALWVLLGRYNAPVPLAECMVGNWLEQANSGGHNAASPGYYTGIQEPTGYILWGRKAERFIARDGAGVWGPEGGLWRDAKGHMVSVGQRREEPARWAEFTERVPGPAVFLSHARISNEPLDHIEPPPPVLLKGGALAFRDTNRLAGALVNAAKMAGGLEAALALSVDYANVRKQFGKPIGQFQAVSQQLSQAAGEVAAAGVAVANAGRAVARRGLAGAEFEIAAAKVITGEAVALVAAVAHQVHAAIGFTQDYHLHFTTRRLWAWRDAFGNERFWAQRIGRAALDRTGAMAWPDLAAREGA